MSRELAVMAKYWQPGMVKTRLASTLGEAVAARLYRSMLETTLTRLHGRAERSTLAFSPRGRRDEFQRIAPSGWRLEPQPAGDLGLRMLHQIKMSLTTGSQRVVLLGSDSPTVPWQYVEQAFQHLTHVEVVLGPTSDGGYYLVGVADRVPDIFEGIRWSTMTVLRDTLDRLERRGIRFTELPPWYDVDDEADLDRLRQELFSGQCDGTEFDGLRRCMRESGLGGETSHFEA